MQELPKVISRGHRSLGEWFAEYVERIDHDGVIAYPDDARRILQSLGKESNDPSVRYIAGQLYGFFVDELPSRAAIDAARSDDFIPQLIADAERAIAITLKKE